MPEPLLNLQNVKRHYQSGDTPVKALDGVSITIWPGEFVAIMGQSGSGKSTLMNIIGCLDRPSDGTYHILGTEVAGLSPDELAALRRETFGFVFQRYNLLGTSSAEENVEIPAVYAGMDKATRVKRARELLTRLGLGDRCDHRPGQLSGGQQQRVAIARSLMNNPPVILADEPTGALDSRSGKEVMDLLKSLHAEGRTVILITHDEKVAENAKRIIRIQDGRVLNDTNPEASDEQKNAVPMKSQEKLNQTGGVMPEISEASITALRALRVNFFRTALTLLGIVIGVAAVVTMLAIGNGSKQKIVDQISAMGTNLLSIRPGAPGVRSSGDNATLTADDATAILDIPNVDQVVPDRQTRLTYRYGNLDYSSTVEGVSPGFPEVRDWAMAEGNFFTERDMRSSAPVIVLGQTVAKSLFPDGGDIVGKYVLVRNIPFEVIGILATKGAAAWGGDQDDTGLVPLPTAFIRLTGGQYVNSISVKISDIDKMDDTQEAIRQLLLARHGVENFSIRNTASLLETVTATQNTLTVLLGAVAAISLLVGGIGVMNIMLVSVTERTREIGIRMATGARQRDIMLQFNTEAAVVCTIGGVLGILIGLLTGWIISLFDVSVLFSVTPALLAFSCAVGTGLLFGYLPAKKAAQLDPVVALASE
ncbi:MAG: transporter family protein [Micavibrio sp.]|nr:transporter family protein [Micavibrio sp.]